jgi:methionyl-tRNA formyltransferase
MYGLRDFVYAGWLYSYYRLRALLPQRRMSDRSYSVAQFARAQEIPLYPCTSVNELDYIKRLEALDIDILLSVAANQRFGSTLLRLPNITALNVHSALLPKYRGMDGLFWALVHGETEVGVTLHVMSEEFDDGPIVGQVAFTVLPSDSLHSLYFRAMEKGAALVAEVLRQYEAGSVVERPNDVSAGSYFSAPTGEAARQFRRNGRRFF